MLYREGEGSSAHNSQFIDRNFSRLINTKGLYEIDQPEHTHADATSSAKLDRVYVNDHLTEQLDKTLSCTATNWWTSPVFVVWFG